LTKPFLHADLTVASASELMTLWRGYYDYDYIGPLWLLLSLLLLKVGGPVPIGWSEVILS